MNRDSGIGRIKSRGTYAYGMGLGIILLDETYPGFPGDVRNASAFPYPIQYEVAEGLDIRRLIYDENKDRYFETVLSAARRLERMGCRAILAECGYFAYFQQMIAAEVGIPVFMSSLLQVTWAQCLIGPSKVVGILMSDAAALLERHQQAVGIRPGSNYVVGDAMGEGQCPQFDSLWTEGIRPQIPRADYQRAEADFIKSAVRFHDTHPNMGAMVLECTGFQPFARALQQKIDMPLFSWGTLMDYAYSVGVHRDFYGHV